MHPNYTAGSFLVDEFAYMKLFFLLIYGLLLGHILSRSNLLRSLLHLGWLGFNGTFKTSFNVIPKTPVNNSSHITVDIP